jgi:hypothetical protein
MSTPESTPTHLPWAFGQPCAGRVDLNSIARVDFSPRQELWICSQSVFLLFYYD